MFEVEIISGRRRGEKLALLSSTHEAETPIIFQEDEVLVFRTKIDQDVPNLTLVLHENEVPYSTRVEHVDGWLYEWHPKEVYRGRKEAFFHNYYGLAELSLAAKKIDDSTQFSFVLHMQPIEVLAKKINAERVSEMLKFLSRQDGKDLASAIRITRLRAGLKEGGRTEQFLLDRIQNNIIFLKKILPDIVMRPITKLRQTERLVTPNEETLIDESSLHWISENPDYLYEIDSHENTLLIYEDERYGSKKIVETHVIESSDLYENHVIHGFIASLMIAINKIREKLASNNTKQSSSTSHFEGYVSFFTQIQKFSDVINANKIAKCDQIISDLRGLRNWLEKKTPVSKIETGLPYFTQKAKQNFLYHQVFSRVITWHRYGTPDWGVQDELNSIKDIPRLFEYYVLCVIKNHLDGMSVNGVEMMKAANDGSQDLFEYKAGQSSIRLMYEPEIWTAGHARSAQQNLVNTEGWSKSYTSNVWDSQQQSKSSLKTRSNRGAYSQRRPDFLIEVSRAGSESHYIIIDAKYTDSEKAFISYLPELTMKYIHGIHQQGTGKNQSKALMIVNPSSNACTRHFHSDEYSIYGSAPVTPALMVTSIDVAQAHQNSSNIKCDLDRLLSLSI